MVTNIKTLDKYDKILLNALMMNSRSSLKNLSNKINRSKSFTQYRLKNLNDKIIEKAYPLINVTKLGFIPFDLYLKTSMSKSEELKCIEILKKERKIFYIERLVGTFSIRISFFEKNISSSSNFIKEILKDFIEKIEDIKINIISSLIKTNNGILNDSLGKSSKLFEINENLLLDKKALKILQIINKNPRFSVLEISEKTKLSREFVKKTIREMEKKKIIIGYTVDIDVEKIGFTSKLLILKLKICDKEKYSGLINFLCSCLAVNTITSYYPDQLISLELIIRDNHEFRNFQIDLLNKFSNLIQKIENLDYFDEQKYNYMDDFLEKIIPEQNL
ncbi:MAG: winged helix-turn-helix transcriptional regulator [Nanoarchaeota archaeon]